MYLSQQLDRFYRHHVASGPLIWKVLTGPAQPANMQYKLAALGVVGQWVTVLITWPLWQLRKEMPNLPYQFYEALGGPEFNFSWLIMVSAGIVLLIPRGGVWIHGVTLLWACLADEMRTQPQFFALWLLMLTVTHDNGIFWGRWFFVSMWFWAGLHKVLSPEWHTSAGWWVFTRAGGDSTAVFTVFTWGTGLLEVVIGVLAIFRPRWAAWPCLAMHLGIAIFLSPWFLNWNFSVIPWNLASGIIGFWVLRNDSSGFPASIGRRLVVALWLMYPAGFYLGWVQHTIAHVLYSATIPQGLITTESTSRNILGWTVINVPFPDERQTLVKHFSRTAEPGDKLHVRDPRALLDDMYFQLQDDGTLQALTREEFILSNDSGVEGILVDDPVATYHLLQAEVKLLARPGEPYVYAAQISRDNYTSELPAYLRGLANLEQLQLADCPATDQDLQLLDGLHRLQGIGLDRTLVTNSCVITLQKFSNLKTVEHASTALTAEAIESTTTAESIR